MKNTKNNRKGFTIVELVIVIAVIAILATVLVPTFGNVIKDAKDAAALQEAKNAYTNYVSDNATTADGYSDVAIYMIDDTTDTYVVIVNGAVLDTTYTSESDAKNAAGTLDEGYAWAEPLVAGINVPSKS